MTTSSGIETVADTLLRGHAHDQLTELQHIVAPGDLTVGEVFAVCAILTAAKDRLESQHRPPPPLKLVRKRTRSRR
jgi:hypothetical protein